MGLLCYLIALKYNVPHSLFGFIMFLSTFHSSIFLNPASRKNKLKLPFV